MKSTFLVFVCLTTLSLNSFADGFKPSHQTRSLSMGGTGIAIPDLTTAITHNPAILSSSKVESGFWLQLPVLTAGVSDDDNFVDSIDEFQDSNIVDRLSDAIDSADLYSSYSNIADLADDLDSQLANLSDKAIYAELGLLGSLSIPNKTIGIGIKASTGLSLGGEIQYRDAQTLTDLASDIRAFDTCLNDNLANPGSCDPRAMQWNYIDPQTGEILFNTDDDISSQVSLNGLAISEIGVSLSTSFKALDKHTAISITPKYQYVSLVDYNVNVQTADIDNIDQDEYLKNYSELNFDTSAFVELSEHWNLGFSASNLLSKEYTTSSGDIAKIKPTAAIGVSYQKDWLTVALDVDATKKTLANEAKEQLVAVGAEIDAFEFARLRFGYQHDLENSDRDLLSAGFGLNIFGLNLDFGAAGNDTRLLASLQLGYRW